MKLTLFLSQIELELIRLFPDGKFNNAGHFPSLRLPANPSRVDRLINEVIREHFKVTYLKIKVKLRTRHIVCFNIFLT